MSPLFSTDILLKSYLNVNRSELCFHLQEDDKKKDKKGQLICVTVPCKDWLFSVT